MVIGRKPETAKGHRFPDSERTEAIENAAFLREQSVRFNCPGMPDTDAQPGNATFKELQEMQVPTRRRSGRHSGTLKAHSYGREAEASEEGCSESKENHSKVPGLPYGGRSKSHKQLTNAEDWTTDSPHGRAKLPRGKSLLLNKKKDTGNSSQQNPSSSSFTKLPRVATLIEPFVQGKTGPAQAKSLPRGNSMSSLPTRKGSSRSLTSTPTKKLARSGTLNETAFPRKKLPHCSTFTATSSPRSPLTRGNTFSGGTKPQPNLKPSHARQQHNGGREDSGGLPRARTLTNCTGVREDSEGLTRTRTLTHSTGIAVSVSVPRQ